MRIEPSEGGMAIAESWPGTVQEFVEASRMELRDTL